MLRLARHLLLLALVFLAGRLAAAEPPEIAALRAKAERGSGLAQYNLGLAYAQGQQVPVDLPEAFAWLTLASENGLAGKDLDGVLANLTDQQLSEGRHRLTRYREALAARTATPSVTTPRKTTGRVFSLTAIPPATGATLAAPTPEVASTRPPSPSAEPMRPGDPLPDELSVARVEIARLKSDLERAQQTVREQAATILKLQNQLTRASAVPAPVSGAARTSPADGSLVKRP